MKLAFAFVAVLATPAHADVELGVALGARMTSLHGQTTKGAGTANIGGGVHVALPLAQHFEVGTEPGMHISGSADYRLVYLGLPLLARFVRPLSGRARVRALAGLVPELLLDAEKRIVIQTPERITIEWHTASAVARFHLAATVGAGLDVPFGRRRVFLEVRASRGLLTVDADNLAVFNQEVGLWAAYLW